MLNNRPLLIIIQAEIKSEIQGAIISRQKVSEVRGPINRPGFLRHKINLNNPPGKNKIQAILKVNASARTKWRPNCLGDLMVS